MITLDDIARACGVSKAAVSYVLNGRNGAFAVSDATKKRIIDECERVGYRPDEAALALSKLKSVPLKLTFMSPWLYSQFSDFSARVYSELERQENISVTFEPYKQNSLSLNSSMLKRSDAVIIAGTGDKDEKYLIKNREALTKVILLNRSLEGYPCSRGNDREASKKLGEVLKNKYSKFYAIERSGGSKLERERISGFCESTCAEITHKAVIDADTLNFFPQYYEAAVFLKDNKSANVAAYDIHALLSKFISPPIIAVDPCLELMTGRAVEAARKIKNGETPTIEITEAKILLEEEK